MTENPLSSTYTPDLGPAHISADEYVAMLCAVRYALGRQSWAVRSVQLHVWRHAQEMGPHLRAKIANDIREAQQRPGGWGDPTVDAPGWQRLLTRLEEE